MRRLLAVATVVAGLCGSPVRAETDIPVDLGARVGIALGFGNSDASGGQVHSMSDFVSWMLPIQVDAAYRFTPQLSAGLYLNYTPYISIPSKNFCTNGVSCSGSDWRFGIQGFYKIPGSRSYQPWVGVGIGKEWATVDLSGNGQSATVKTTGWEYFNLQGGADWVVHPNVTAGPYAMFTASQYSDQETSQGGGTRSYTFSSAETRFHYFLFLGVKGSYRL